MTIHIIYHLTVPKTDTKPGTPCPDGFMAAAVVARWLKSQGLEYTVQGDAYRHEDDYPEFPDFELPPETSTLYLCDFSYPKQWLNFWGNNGVRVIVYEHHEKRFAALTDTNMMVRKVLNAGECGATLAWMDLYPELDLAHILPAVRDRDIGTNGYYEKNPTPEGQESIRINAALAAIRHNIRQFSTQLSELDRSDPEVRSVDIYASILNSDRSTVEYLAQQGEVLVAADDAIIAKAIKRHTPRIYIADEIPVWYGYLRLTADEARLNSRIGSEMLNAYPDLKFAHLITPDGRCHLRSLQGGYDVQPIAVMHGGDGHPNAAGFAPMSGFTHPTYHPTMLVHNPSPEEINRLLSRCYLTKPTANLTIAQWGAIARVIADGAAISTVSAILLSSQAIAPDDQAWMLQNNFTVDGLVHYVKNYQSGHCYEITAILYRCNMALGCELFKIS